MGKGKCIIRIYDENTGELLQKSCSKCGKVKDVSEFYKDKSKSGGLKSNCKSCYKESIKKYREANPDRIKEHRKEYREAKKQAKTKEWKQKLKHMSHNEENVFFQKNLLRVYKGNDFIFRRCCKCHELHPVDMFKKDNGNKDGLENCCKYYSNLRKREYNKTPQGRLSKKRQRHNRRVREKKGTWTLEQWEECLKFFDNKCAYTGQPMDVVTMDHIVALNKGGTNNISNIIPADVSPNSSKCDKDIFEWYSKQPYFSWERYLKICMWIIKNM